MILSNLKRGGLFNGLRVMPVRGGKFIVTANARAGIYVTDPLVLSDVFCAEQEITSLVEKEDASESDLHASYMEERELEMYRRRVRDS